LSKNADQHRYTLDNPSDFLSLLESEDFKNQYNTLKTGELPKGECSICRSVEADPTTTNSQRQKINSLTKNGFYLKIDFSNKCNLKCVMCSSSRSTGWIKDEQKLKAMDFKVDNQQYQTIGDAWWENIPLSWWKNVGTIELSGGEPLYQEDALKFIDFLSNNVPTCYLRIMTNGTLIDDSVLNNLNKFENINVAVSVDAWQDDVYRYSRGDHFSIDHTKDNLQRLLSIFKNKKRARVGICDTLHPINYDQAPIGKQWVYDWGISNSSNILSYNVGYVHKPYHLDIRKILPKEIYPPSSEDKELQIYFYKWIVALDKIRKTNILEVRPEFTEWFKTLEDLV
jgi:MoaA/NifB/PqqE/SkfB family radical SAM enzyme